jgi:hypothetical protein
MATSTSRQLSFRREKGMQGKKEGSTEREVRECQKER